MRPDFFETCTWWFFHSFICKFSINGPKLLISVSNWSIINVFQFFHPTLYCYGISISEMLVWLRIEKHFFCGWRETFTILVASSQLLWFLISYKPKQKKQTSGSSPPGATFRFWISWVVQEELAFTFPHLVVHPVKKGNLIFYHNNLICIVILTKSKNEIMYNKTWAIMMYSFPDFVWS